MRRVAIRSSIHSSLLRNGDEVYGAIISGKHLFYVKEKGTERLNDRADFVMLWLKKDNRWLAARIISYAHADVKRR